MAEIVCTKLQKVYSDGTEAVKSLDLEIEDGQFMVLVGPSGCGKTTLLRLIAGLEDVTGGSIRIGDRVVNDIPAKDRDIGMVFQSYALYPHMSVADNIGFGLKLRHTGKQEIRRAVRETAGKLGLQELLNKKPRQLSGGQRQRVAMGRAIVRKPKVFLMDEPLSNLDAKLRVQMRGEIGRLQRDLGVTTVYVTHDQTEAMTLGDRVAVMRHGVLQQLAAPQELYRTPSNLFVAGFIGSPAMNFVQARLRVREGGAYVLEFGGIQLDVPPSVRSARPALASYEGREVVLGVRPEHICDPAELQGAPVKRQLRVLVELREELGAETFIHFTVEAPPVLTEDIRELAADTDEATLADLEERVEAQRTHFVARVGPQIEAEVGRTVELTIDPHRLYFFDPFSGVAISGEGTLMREVVRVEAG